MILKWLLQGKRPRNKPGATPAGPACGLPGTGSNTAPAAPPKGGAPKPCGNCFVAGTLVKTRSGRTFIERMSVRDRVNPALLEGWDRSAIPLEGRFVDWRRIELIMLRDNSPCGTATLLRPAAWVEDDGAVIGQTIFLNLPEIGIEGPAQVVSIEEMFVGPGPGRLVTGVFRHTSGEILDLQIEGEHQPLGTTRYHPFWSVDRED